jgi:hypothetical protein
LACLRQPTTPLWLPIQGYTQPHRMDVTYATFFMKRKSNKRTVCPRRIAPGPRSLMTPLRASCHCVGMISTPPPFRLDQSRGTHVHHFYGTLVAYSLQYESGPGAIKAPMHDAVSILPSVYLLGSILICPLSSRSSTI